MQLLFQQSHRLLVTFVVDVQQYLFTFIHLKLLIVGSGCVAQLVERLLPIPEVCGPNPIIGKKIIYFEHLFLSTVY